MFVSGTFKLKPATVGKMATTKISEGKPAMLLDALNCKLRKNGVINLSSADVTEIKCCSPGVGDSSLVFRMILDDIKIV